jgi:hypothetical protein
MIEKDLLTYLQGQAALTTPLGGDNKIVIVQAPIAENFKLPWLVIENSGGTRTQITSGLIEEVANVRISVDAGPAQWVLGREIAEIALHELEHYRGLLGDANDLYITCSSIRSYAGVISTYRYQFECRIRWIETLQKP